MSDMISRQAAIDAICDEWCYATYDNCPHRDEEDYTCDGCDDIKRLESIPSADRPTGWIPCSERLPEEDGLYIVTTSKGQVQVHVLSHNGNSEEYWMRCDKAWMPLPEPYKGGAE